MNPIKKARKQAGLTQRELAEKLGVATGTVQQWELGARTPTVKKLSKIAEALNVSLVELLPPDVLGEKGKTMEEREKTTEEKKDLSIKEYLRQLQDQRLLEIKEKIKDVNSYLEFKERLSNEELVYLIINCGLEDEDFLAWVSKDANARLYKHLLLLLKASGRTTRHCLFLLEKTKDVLLQTCLPLRPEIGTSATLSFTRKC